MQHRDGQHPEARFSCTAQVIRNNQNILNELRLFMVQKTLEGISQEYKQRKKKMNVECILYHPVICATVSSFSRQIPVITAYNGNLRKEKKKKRRNTIKGKPLKLFAACSGKIIYLYFYAFQMVVFFVLDYKIYTESMCYFQLCIKCMSKTGRHPLKRNACI